MIRQNILRTQISTRTYVRDTSVNQITPSSSSEEETQPQTQPTETTDETSAEQSTPTENSTSRNSK